MYLYLYNPWSMYLRPVKGLGMNTHRVVYINCVWKAVCGSKDNIYVKYALGVFNRPQILYVYRC